MALSFDQVGNKDGTPLVLLHGFPLDRTMWRFQLTPLSEAGFRLVVPDLRGCGKSDGGPTITVPDMASDVVHLLDELQIPKAIVVGFSMGGYVALQLAADHPDRFQALVLMDTRAEPDTDDARKKRLGYIPEIERNGPKILLDAMMGVLLTPESLRNRKGLVELVWAIMARQKPANLNLILQGLADRPDQRPRLGSIACPTLIVAGEKDPVTPAASQDVLHQGIAGSKKVILPGLGHLTPMEGPDHLNKAVLEFLAPYARPVARRAPTAWPRL